MRLYLIRHPRPEIAPGICYGSTDIAVPQSEQQRALAALMPSLPQMVPVYSSPLRRCSEFASKLAVATDAPEWICDPRLAEIHFGDWEMRRWEEISRAEVDAWVANLIDYCPGGGESVMQMALRVNAFLFDMRLRKSNEASNEAIVVCHAGTVRMLLECSRNAVLEEAARAAAQVRRDIAYGELIVLEA